MNSLLLVDIQNQFWQALSQSKNTVIDLISTDDEFNVLDRINVYRTTARLLHVSVLESVYPVCEKILGKDYFKFIAKKYFIKHPSLSPGLNDYGEQFPEFLSRLIDARDELNGYEHLPDLAALEWCIQKSYYSGDNAPLDMQRFQQQCEQYGGDVKFSLAPSVLLLDCNYPVHEIWSLHQQQAIRNAIGIPQQGEKLCIYRDAYEVKLENIDEHSYKLMLAIKKNSTLSTIADSFDNGGQLNTALSYVMSKQWLRI